MNNPASALPPVSPGKAAAEYIIGPGDVLTVIVWEHPELIYPTANFAVPSARAGWSAPTARCYPHAGSV